jgi:hypothetical protein
MSHYILIGKTPTKAGARTSLIVLKLKRIWICIAVPNYDKDNSEVEC